MDELFLIGVLGISVTLIFFGFVLLLNLVLKLQKKRGGPFILEVSESFQKDLEKLITDQTKKDLVLLGEKILREHQKILDEYQKFQKEIFQLQKVSKENQDKIVKETEKAIAELTNKFKTTYSEISDLLIEQAKMKTEDLAGNLKKEILNALLSTQKILEKEVIKTEEEIKSYKKERIKELDKRIYLILGEIAKKTLGEAIDLSGHEELVMEALEKAKKEGIF